MPQTRVRQTLPKVAAQNEPAAEEIQVPEAPAGPKVSALLIARNQEEELRRAITALERSSNRTEIEIIAVDCASEDGTGELDQEFPNITLLRLPQNFGATRAMNIATRTAKADLLFFVSPDVEVAPDTISRLLGEIDKESDTSAVCALLVDPGGNPVPTIQPLPDPQILAAICSGNEPPAAELDLTQESIGVGYPGRDALLVRKQFIIGMNYFDERFSEYWADADLAIKIRRAGRKIRLYPAIRVTHHEPENRAVLDTDHLSDRTLGAGVLIQKHYGYFAALGFRISAGLKALLTFQFGLLAALLGGKRAGEPTS